MGDTASVRNDFEKTLGFRSVGCEQLLAAAPDYFEAYLDYAAVTYRSGVLPKTVQEFTLNASVTHPYAPALRVHITNALRIRRHES